MNRRRNSYNSTYYKRVYENRYNYTYNNTSEAYELYTYEEDEIQSRRQKAKQAKEAALQREKMPVGMLKVMLCVAVVFGMSVTYLSVSAGNNARYREIVSMNEQLETLNENNAYLETRLNETVDLKRIEELASTRLGMSKPKSYQIKYIDVQKESYTVQYKTDSKDSLTFVEAMSNLFKD